MTLLSNIANAFKRKTRVIQGKVRRMGQVIIGCDDTVVHHALVLEGAENVVLLWVPSGAMEWETKAAIALTSPGDDIEVEVAVQSDVRDQRLLEVVRFENHSFKA